MSLFKTALLCFALTVSSNLCMASGKTIYECYSPYKLGKVDFGDHIFLQNENNKFSFASASDQTRSSYHFKYSDITPRGESYEEVLQLRCKRGFFDELFSDRTCINGYRKFRFLKTLSIQKVVSSDLILVGFERAPMDELAEAFLDKQESFFNKEKLFLRKLDSILCVPYPLFRWRSFWGYVAIDDRLYLPKADSLHKVKRTRFTAFDIQAQRDVNIDLTEPGHIIEEFNIREAIVKHTNETLNSRTVNSAKCFNLTWEYVDIEQRKFSTLKVLNSAIAFSEGPEVYYLENDGHIAKGLHNETLRIEFVTDRIFLIAKLNGESKSYERTCVSNPE